MESTNSTLISVFLEILFSIPLHPIPIVLNLDLNDLGTVSIQLSGPESYGFDTYRWFLDYRYISPLLTPA